MAPETLALVAITFVAAAVNGALGYGFSSITVPIALMFYTNRVLNPSLVLIEVALNSYMLWNNAPALSAVWRRVLPIIVGLVPGIVLGTTFVYSLSPAWVKFGTFAVLTPLILLQAAGIRRPLRSERSAAFGLGGGVGVLYSVTTISGPPLALMFNNQGFARQDFRAGLAIVRLAESSMTAAAYLYVGMFTFESVRLVPLIIPSIALGIPLGACLVRRVPAQTLAVCMSFDAWIIGFGPEGAERSALSTARRRSPRWSLLGLSTAGYIGSSQTESRRRRSALACRLAAPSPLIVGRAIHHWLFAVAPSMAVRPGCHGNLGDLQASQAGSSSAADRCSSLRTNPARRS